MTSTIQPKNIDYDAIFTGLLERADQHFDWLIQESRFTPPECLRDFATIGISSPRQSGRSTWAIEQVVKHNALMVTTNELVAKHWRNRTPRPYKSQIITMRDLAKVIKDEMPAPTSTGWHPWVILDESRYIFELVSFRDFYKWLALNPNWRNTRVFTLN